MSENAIDSENTSKAAPNTAKPKGARKAGKTAKPAKKAARAKKLTSKPKADRPNKKAEVIDMMKRAKGATSPEIMKATAWQAHTVRGLRQHPGQQGWGEDRVVQEHRGRTNVQDRQITFRQLVVQTPPRPRATGGVPASRRK